MTRPLQIGLSAYFILEWIVAWPQLWATIGTFRATGQTSGAAVVITAFAFVTILIALLTYDCLYVPRADIGSRDVFDSTDNDSLNEFDGVK